MTNYSNDAYLNAIKELDKSIHKCEGIHPKFKVGTSQHTLLINRIKALKICKSLIEDKINISSNVNYTKKELDEALNPIVSIKNKCLKAQSKYDLNNKQYNRYISLIDSMFICETLIKEAQSK